jgi:hypothetical protein
VGEGNSPTKVILQNPFLMSNTENQKFHQNTKNTSNTKHLSEHTNYGLELEQNIYSTNQIEQME